MPLSYLSLLLMLLLLGLLASSTAVALMAFTLLRPPRMTDGRSAWLLQRLSPTDLGLAYERAPFVIHDELRRGDQIALSAWWIPAAIPSSRCAILLHDYGDAKVGVIAWAPLWHSLGFNILAIDLRAHGESGGRFTTAGYHERHDLAKVIHDLRAERPRETGKLVLFGVGYGAAIAAATAAELHDLAAVILDSPFADFSRFSESYMNRIGFPGLRFQRLAIWVAAHIARSDWSEVRPVDAIARISAPLAIILPGDDEMSPPGDAQLLEGALLSRKQAEMDLFWCVPQAGRLLALTANPEEYRRKLAEFLERALG